MFLLNFAPQSASWSIGVLFFQCLASDCSGWLNPSRALPLEIVGEVSPLAVDALADLLIDDRRHE